VKVTQSKVASFFIDNSNEEEVLAYIEKNAPLFQSSVLLFSQPLSEALKKCCQQWKLSASYNYGGIKNKADKIVIARSKASREDSSHTYAKEIFRTIRSGERITHEGDLLVSGDVNDGASLTSAGNMSIFGTIQGDIECQGTYLIIKSFKRGRVMFQGDVINKYILGDDLKIIYKDNEELKVKDLH